MSFARTGNEAVIDDNHEPSTCSTSTWSDAVYGELAKSFYWQPTTRYRPIIIDE